MVKLYYYGFTRGRYLIGLIGFAALLNGCTSQYRIEQEAQHNQFIQEQQALVKQQAALAEERREIELKRAQLDEENEMIASAKEELEQEKRKLEILKKTLHPQQNSTKPAPLSSTIPMQTQTSRQVRLRPSTVEYSEIPHILIGQLEKVFLQPPGLTFTARVDTGTEISSLTATNLTKFERDGKPYIRFHILHPKTGKPIELVRRIRKHKRIKELDEEAQKRPIVRLRVVLGGIDQRIDFSLIERTNSEYPILIGRNFLSDFAIVDVSKQFLTKPEVQP